MPFLRAEGVLDEDQLARLASVGVRTVVDLLSSDVCEVAVDSGVCSQALHESVSRLSKKYYEERDSCRASLLLEKLRSTQTKIDSHCEGLDNILGGGLRSGEMSELIGEEGCGKTQLCHHLALSVAEEGKTVVYLDTEATFSAERIVKMLKVQGKTNRQIKRTLNKIIVYGVRDVNQLFDYLYEVQEESKECFKDTKLLVVDSLAAILVPHLLSLEHNDEKREARHVRQEVIRTLSTLFVKRPELGVIVTSTHGCWLGKTWKNACALSLRIASAYRSGLMVREVTVLKSHRLMFTEGNDHRCLLTLDDQGFKDWSH